MPDTHYQVKHISWQPIKTYQNKTISFYPIIPMSDPVSLQRRTKQLKLPIAVFVSQLVVIITRLNSKGNVIFLSYINFFSNNFLLKLFKICAFMYKEKVSVRTWGSTNLRYLSTTTTPNAHATVLRQTPSFQKRSKDDRNIVKATDRHTDRPIVNTPKWKQCSVYL